MRSPNLDFLGRFLSILFRSVLITKLAFPKHRRLNRILVTMVFIYVDGFVMTGDDNRCINSCSETSEETYCKKIIVVLVNTWDFSVCDQ